MRPGRMPSTMKSLGALLHHPRFQPAWRAVLLVLVLIAAWFAFMPAPQLDVQGGDKVNHLLAFGSMAVAGRFGWSSGRAALVGVALGLLGYGGFIELVQSQIPGRDAAWDDLLADAIGIAGGVLLAALLRRLWPLRS